MGRPPTSLYEVYLASSLRLAYLFRETEPPEGLDARLHVPLADWLSARTLPNNFSTAWRQSALGIIPAHPISQTCVRSEGRSGFQLAARVLVRETELRVLVPPSHRSAATLRLDVPTRSTCQLAFHPDTSQQIIPSFGPCTTTTFPTLPGSSDQARVLASNGEEELRSVSLQRFLHPSSTFQLRHHALPHIPDNQKWRVL